MKNKNNETHATLSPNKNGHVPRLTDPGLWSRIWDAHPALLADEGYRARLRDEAGIEPGDHDDLIREYLRFAYLSWTSPDGATPSKAVDEAWHAHILFTRSYVAFCQAANGAYLHHQPGTGGAGDEERFRDLYHMTLDRYLAEFGEPPARWWPDDRPPRPAPQGRPGKAAGRAFNALLLIVLPAIIVGGVGRLVAGPGTFSLACLGIGALVGGIPALMALSGAGEASAATGRPGRGGDGSGTSGSSCSTTFSSCSASGCSGGCGGGGCC